MTDFELKANPRSDLFLGALVGLTVAFVAALAGRAVIVPALGVLGLVASWFWKNRIFRGFAVTLVTLTLVGFGLFWAVYLPYMLAPVLKWLLGH